MRTSNVSAVSAVSNLSLKAQDGGDRGRVSANSARSSASSGRGVAFLAGIGRASDMVLGGLRPSRSSWLNPAKRSSMQSQKSIVTVATMDSMHEIARRSNAARTDAVHKFLKDCGFRGINEPRRFRRWFSWSSEKIYPVHLVSMQGDHSLLMVILAAAANPLQTTSRGRTALSIAEEYDEDGSHADVMALLQSIEQNEAETEVRAEQEALEGPQPDQLADPIDVKPRVSGDNLEKLLEDPILTIHA